MTAGKEHSAPLIAHLRELRSRVVIMLAAFLAAFVICYGFAGDIYRFLAAPLAGLSSEDAPRRLIYTGLAEAFVTYIKLAAFAGFALAFPVIAWQVYAFIAPGLYKRERGAFAPFLIAAPLLFLAGAALAYYFVFTMAWRFFLGFEITGADGALPLQLEARISEYLSLAMGLMIGFGLCFQLPLVLILLVRAGLVSVDALRSKRRHAIVGMFALAAVMTPPDVISQIGLALPLLLLYEGAIVGCRWAARKEN